MTVQLGVVCVRVLLYACMYVCGGGGAFAGVCCCTSVCVRVCASVCHRSGEGRTPPSHTNLVVLHPGWQLVICIATRLHHRFLLAEPRVLLERQVIITIRHGGALLGWCTHDLERNCNTDLLFSSSVVSFLCWRCWSGGSRVLWDGVTGKGKVWGRVV